MTSDLLQARGFGTSLQCFLCSSELEFHSHLFFLCDFSMNILRKVILIGHLFLMNITLHQAFSDLDYIEWQQIRRLCLLIIVVTVYVIWRERNYRFRGSGSSSAENLAGRIKLLVSYKLNCWSFKIVGVIMLWRSFQVLG